MRKRVVSILLTAAMSAMLFYGLQHTDRGTN